MGQDKKVTVMELIEFIEKNRKLSKYSDHESLGDIADMIKQKFNTKVEVSYDQGWEGDWRWVSEIVTLPEYGISVMNTGSYESDTGTFWQEEITPVRKVTKTVEVWEIYDTSDVDGNGEEKSHESK